MQNEPLIEEFIAITQPAGMWRPTSYCIFDYTHNGIPYQDIDNP
jgi:hypothetical protein